MGNLGGQLNRNLFQVSNENIDQFLEGAADLAKKHSTTIAVVVEAKRVLEMERNNSILVQAGDYHDEHLAGFGEILSRIADMVGEKYNK